MTLNQIGWCLNAVMLIVLLFEVVLWLTRHWAFSQGLLP